MTQSTSSESLEGRPLNRNLFLNINEKRISLKDQGSNKINRCKKIGIGSKFLLLFQQVIFLNRELVDRGLAEWDMPPDSWAAAPRRAVATPRRAPAPLPTSINNDAD